ncbi:efflux RND transporter periplasmic adaptor subunit [Variovorax saccharolyticus]|uniref:efflux RND transporter periplasmic adaptor subunit n=1 Tax=Variovorax saccharolyticus TaxID=3053516 RepID=UPI002578C4D5|nr:efflux RND transporter periplasmic adaptor subunit [Variovorax sp. J31P216]MDM0028981.1 efflux RND transporter periplasmic adaptor subunit [Variovorax sp. J31P216]
MHRRFAKRPAWMAASLFALACAGCGGEQGSAAGSAPPPIPVSVLTVAASPVANVVELPGRIEAVRTAEVRARVDGIVERRLYQEGTDVAAGAPLFLIDPRDYQALLQQAQATLSRAEAGRANAASIVARFRPLVSRQAVSAQEFEAAETALRQAEAGVADASAEVTRAKLRFERSTVRAPIAGRVGRAQVTEGALVSAGAATLLTQINQLSPISAVFTQSNTAILDFAQQVRAGTLKMPDAARVEVRLILANGQEYGEPGYLDFADLAVDPSTGTQTIRAQFANASRTLLPGQFVRGRIFTGIQKTGIRVPERAIQLDGSSASVALVGPDGTLLRRNVQVGAQEQGQWVVLDGLQAGDQLIVDGWHKVGPGQKVSAQPVPPASSTAR